MNQRTLYWQNYGKFSFALGWSIVPTYGYSNRRGMCMGYLFLVVTFVLTYICKNINIWCTSRETGIYIIFYWNYATLSPTETILLFSGNCYQQQVELVQERHRFLYWCNSLRTPYYYLRILALLKNSILHKYLKLGPDSCSPVNNSSNTISVSFCLGLGHYWCHLWFILW